MRSLPTSDRQAAYGVPANSSVRSSRRRRPNMWTRMQNLDVALYLMVGMVAASWMMGVMGMSIAAMLTLAAIPVLLPEASLNLYCKAEVAWNRSGIGRTMPFGAAMSVACVAMLTFTLATAQPEAAQAQFFKKAEEYVTTKLAAGAPGADKAVELIFAVLRGLFLIYLGISIVRIVQAARNDQDWQDLARTPLIILIAVVLGDVLSGFIIGGA
jgi:hypothetical protein